MSQWRTGSFIAFSILWVALLAAQVTPALAFLANWLLLGILLVMGAVLFLPALEARAAAPASAKAPEPPAPIRIPTPAPAPAAHSGEDDASAFEIVSVNENKPVTPRVARAAASHHAPLREKDLDAPVVAAAPHGTFFPSDGNGNATAKLTRGMCSRCGTHLTLSARRPLRATCPVCGHSKVLN